ncbi:rna-directed dna polymerase from mobile element jockey-like [Willisornis vidua]|uniref:Rna-directed dna polymerase from mobile element jockey-like n=1 Tax=Willisornis vidua TaxID=1566151 RepID=A0ABQ9DEU3_9PASS|nr:rna-directed dna polymerase from mobile element jockey-like [Willisornis vidua]
MNKQLFFARPRQGSILVPVLFNIFISDLDTGLEEILSKFADNTRLRGAVDSLKRREALQRDLDCIITNHMNFNKAKCRILHLEWGNPSCMDRLGNEMLESNALESDLGVLVNGKLNPTDHEVKEYKPLHQQISIMVL